MNFEILFVLVGLIGMLVALIMDKMRPGIVLLSLVVVFMAAGIITPKQMVAGFSNRGMITVGLLFLVSEGIRQSGALATVIKKLLPERKMTVMQAQLRLLPVVSGSGYFRPDCEELGEESGLVVYQIPHSFVVCHDFRRFVYPDWHLYQLGGARHDDRPWLAGAEDVRPCLYRHSHYGGRAALYLPDFEEIASSRASR